MSNRGFVRRVGKLEEKMDVPEFEKGSTRIAWECLSWREQKLLERINELLREHSDECGGVHVESLVEYDELLTKGTEILVKRAFDIFASAMNPFLRGEKLNEYIFWMRFHAFLVSTLNIIEMRRREDAYYQKIEEKYGDNWPDDVGEPDLSGIGERDFNNVLKQQIEDEQFFRSNGKKHHVEDN
jgi:hypothetical protein